MYQRNSTIRVKEKICIRCGKPCFWFSKKRCATCTKIEDTFARMEQEAEAEEGFPELRDELDGLVSRYLRLSNADKDGLVQCYTCSNKLPVNEMQAGHYISRGCMLLRYDIDRNLRCQCPECNEYKRGNLAIYGQKLEAEMPGITEVLYQESLLVYKYTRQELKAMINEYSSKLKSLKR